VVGSVGGGRASALVLDPVGNPVTCGYTVNVQNDPLNPAALDFTVAKFEAVTGANVWQRTLSGTAPNSGDECLALTENSAGDVLAVGYFDDAGTGIDFAVVKLSGADGTELWRRAIDGTFSGQLEGDLAFAAATDTDGNVVAVGRTKNNGTGVDFTVAKLSGVDGAVGLVTAPPPCCQDAECADSDPCTIDSCTSVGCVSQQGPTFVDCRLGAAEEALGTILMIIRDAQPKKLGGKVQAQRLTAEVTRSRHLIAGARRNSHTARKKLRKAEALLTHFRGAVVFGAREGKIDPELAQRLLALLPCRRLLGAPPLSCSLL